MTAVATAQQKTFLIDSLPFNRMIIKDITYAITGENTPVSGIKLDISKPEGTISGMYPTKNPYLPWDILSFELKGEVTDKNFNFLKGSGSPGAAFEFRPSLHYITWHNKLYYGLPGENVTKKSIAILENIQLDNRMVKTIHTLYTL